MSTRCLIAKRQGRDEYRTIYCHSDGYPGGVGLTLLYHYGYPEKIDKLLDLGDISILDQWIEPDPSRPHGFGFFDAGDGIKSKRQEGVTLSYKRDRGETGVDARVYTLKELGSHGVDYVYIFDDMCWKYFSDIKEGMVRLNEDGLLPF